jgi:hypothetical protein
MWVNLWTYDKYCHDCIWPIWTGAFMILGIFSCIGWGLYLHRKRDEKNTHVDIPNIFMGRQFFEKAYAIEFPILYIFFVVLVFVITTLKSVHQLIDDSYPDDYIRLQNQIKLEGEHCATGVVSGYKYPSNQGQSYYSIYFENNSEFRYKSRDKNNFCFGSTRFPTAISQLIHKKLSVSDEVGNVELNLCWTRNVNSSFGSRQPYSGVCLYQVDARLVN